MALSVCSSKLVSNAVQELHDEVSNVTTSSCSSTRKFAATNAGRRSLLSSTATAVLAVAVTTDANDSQTALLQKYLKKSEENKEKNDKERLENFYKRNYKDYFGFVEGTLRAKDEKQLSESERGILEWLDKNK